MNLTFAFLVLFFAADLKANLDSLIQTERAFARTAMEKSVRAAFLSFIDNTGIIFRPVAVAGRKWLEDSPPTTSLLIWEPSFADISTAGDLGYTAGPWENRHSISEPPRAYGHYVTIWKKQLDGTWKFMLDIGIGHDNAAPKPESVESPAIQQETIAPTAKAEIDKVRADLLRMDSGYGTGNFAPGIRVYRDGSLPMIAPREYPLEKLSWKAMDAAVSANLAYTYGTAGPNNYLHIWKKQADGTWKVVLDLLTANQ